MDTDRPQHRLRHASRIEMLVSTVGVLTLVAVLVAMFTAANDARDHSASTPIAFGVTGILTLIAGALVARAGRIRRSGLAEAASLLATLERIRPGEVPPRSDDLIRAGRTTRNALLHSDDVALARRLDRALAAADPHPVARSRSTRIDGALRGDDVRYRSLRTVIVYQQPL